MAQFGHYEWEDDSQNYSPSQVEAVLAKCGIKLDSETYTHFIGYCPFHGNTDSPAFEVDKYTGQWLCFNPTCGESSNDLSELLRRRAKMSPLEANIFIAKRKGNDGISLVDAIENNLAEKVDFVAWDEGVTAAFKNQFWQEPAAVLYMHSRGFTDETLDYFDIGYSGPNARREFPIVTVPMHDPTGMLIGFIGRTPSNDDKRFKNSPKLPKTKTCWNYHRAKRVGDTVIIVEAAYDAMRIHQAGYPNVVALLGGHLSPHHAQQLGRTFSKFIIMTDNDKKIYKPNCKPCGYKECQGHRPGRDLGRQVVSKIPNKKYLWAAYDDTCIYPHGAKDAADMTDNEIRQCIKNAVSDLTYSLWGIEESLAS